MWYVHSLLLLLHLGWWRCDIVYRYLWIFYTGQQSDREQRRERGWNINRFATCTVHHTHTCTSWLMRTFLQCRNCYSCLLFFFSVLVLLNGYFDQIISILEKNQGDVHKFCGEYVVATTNTHARAHSYILPSMPKLDANLAENQGGGR